MAPFISRNENIYNTRFSSDGRAIFVCSNFKHNDESVIKVWRPYLDDDDDDEDHLTTLWRGTRETIANCTITFSNDNTMVAIHDDYRKKDTLWSIDSNHKCLTKKLDFPKSTGLYFTPDGKYIIYNTENGSTVWNT